LFISFIKAETDFAFFKIFFLYLKDKQTKNKKIMNEVSKPNRFIALLIDGAICYVPVLILAFIAGATGMNFLVYIGQLAALGYLLLKDALFGGQSIGKKAMKYAAVREDGTSLSGDFGASALRNVTLLIPLLDAIFVIIDKPRLGDTLAKTKVVNKAA
jgi:uncharacterized RDD family membrane protein YckC